MQEQLGFMGFEPEPQSPHTLFFAINPDADTAMRVKTLRAQLIDRHGLKGTLIGTPLLHVTLLDLGLFAEHKVGIAMKAAESVAIASLPLDIVFDCAMSFAGGRALVLAGGGGNASLAALRQNLEVAMRKLGLRANPVKTPHLTLMHGSRMDIDHPVEPIRWTARKFALIRSHVGDTLHEPLGTWPGGH